MIVTVVGNYPKIPNLPKPARLRNALARLDRGDITLEELAQVEDRVTREVIQEQEAAGPELLTDGQIRWLDEQTYLAGKLAGVSLNGLARFFDTNTYFREPTVESAIGWQEPITVADYLFAKQQTSLPVKAVLTGPYTLARLSQDEYYGDLERLAMDYAAALNQEALALQRANPPLIQFNEPAITVHPEDIALAGRVWRRLLQGLTVETAVYFYFGAPGEALGAAIDAGFGTVGVDATRPGVIEAVKAGPQPTRLALGVIDARTTRLESIDQIRKLIEGALAFRSDADLYINPNQGLEFLPREQAEAKLKTMVAAVNQVRGAKA